MKRKELKTKRLILRALRSSDYNAWFDAYVNGLPQKNRWDLAPMKASQCTRAVFKKVKDKQEKLARKDDYYRYYVFEKSSGAIVGLIDFDIYVRGSHQFANYGYQIYNRYWRKGYGLEASKAGLIIGFKHLKLNRLEAAINLDNKASLKLSKKIGMKKEGIKRRYWFEFGKWTDHVIYVANPEDVGLKARPPTADLIH